MKPYDIIGTAITFGCVGILATFWPRTIQRWALIAEARRWVRPKGIRDFIASEVYVPMVRVIGIVALGVALLALLRLIPDSWLAW